MSIPSIPRYGKLSFDSLGINKPSSSGTTTTYTIANNTDDGSTVSNSTFSSNVQFNGSLSNSSNSGVNIGAQDDEGEIQYFVGYFRFTNVAIDQGATVQSAILKPIKKSSSGSASKDFEIAGRDVNDAGVPSSASTLGSNRTTARVTLPKSTVFDTTNGNRFDTPDIKTIIQEIVNRAGWSSGNSIVLVLYTPTQDVSSPIKAVLGSKAGTDQSAQLEITV